MDSYLDEVYICWQIISGILTKMKTSEGWHRALAFFSHQGWKPLPFQQEAWENCLGGRSGIVNAPTGSGKTYSLLMPALIRQINRISANQDSSERCLRLIWITPIKALAREIQLSCERAIKGMGLNWVVETRTGDSTGKERKSQFLRPPHILVTTPESLHVLLATNGYPSFFKGIEMVVVDEWHELLGSKRGVQTELALSRLRAMHASLLVWGISATIGNLEEATDVLLYGVPKSMRKVIKASIEKRITLKSVIPDEIDKFPWAGHLGLKLADRVAEIVRGSASTLIFTNTRAQCEIWYQRLLELDPELAGQMAMHHGSISRDIREWVEEALYEGRIRAVVCTSSLDLGVDFRPVETIIQVGSPKGVSRFIQRAGRSGHQPGAESTIWFVPTHALELIEAAGLRKAVANRELEERIPYIRSFDVLIQYLMTLAVSEGFVPEMVVEEIRSTHCFASMTDDEWRRILAFLLYGSDSLRAYDEYQKVEMDENGVYRVTDKRKALRHRLSIGTIVSDAMISIQLLRGTRLGSIEEWFVSQLQPGDVFWFAGKALELVRVKEMVAQVRLSKSKTGKVPAYMGGRMPLSSQLSAVLQEKMHQFVAGEIVDPEIEALKPVFATQQGRSMIPSRDEFLIEYFESKEGYHLVMYPFEGRNVHEGMAVLLAKRISAIQPITFTLAMNDLGFELLSDQPLDVVTLINPALFSTRNLSVDIQSSLNSVEMARRKFRDVARISGLLFSGFPGRMKKERHLQSSSQLLFEVFREYEPDNLLFLQTYDEVMTFQLEEARLRRAMQKISASRIRLVFPQKATPFAFPIMVDRLREKLSSEKLEDRIRKMTVELLK
jgi:ATP-dependent Lhr-like helicase